MNDLTLECISGTRMVLFTDDLALWTNEAKNTQDSLNTPLKKALEKLNIWCSNNAIFMNLSKITCQFFALNKHLFYPDPKFQAMALQETDIMKYLGCVLDCKLSWNRHVEYICEKVVKRLPVLKRLLVANGVAAEIH